MKIPRLPWDQYWMLQAHLTATRSTCDRGPELLFDPGRHGVGAVLVKNKRLIAGGYNGSAPGQPHCNQLLCTECKTVLNIIPDSWDLPAAKDLRMPEAEQLVGKKHNECPGCSSAYSSPGTWKGGHLMREGHCVRTIHSEMNALMQCALDGVSPAGADLYCTASPCFDCAKAIIRAGIARVHYGQAYDSRYGLSGDVQDLLNATNVQTGELVITREDLNGTSSKPIEEGLKKTGKIRTRPLN